MTNLRIIRSLLFIILILIKLTLSSEATSPLNFEYLVSEPKITLCDLFRADLNDNISLDIDRDCLWRISIVIKTTFVLDRIPSIS